MKITVYKDAGAEYRWRIQAKNGRIVADGGEGYKGRMKAIRAVTELLGLGFPSGDLGVGVVLVQRYDRGDYLVNVAKGRHVERITWAPTAWQEPGAEIITEFVLVVAD